MLPPLLIVTKVLVVELVIKQLPLVMLFTQLLIEQLTKPQFVYLQLLHSQSELVQNLNLVRKVQCLNLVALFMLHHCLLLRIHQSLRIPPCTLIVSVNRSD